MAKIFPYKKKTQTKKDDHFASQEEWQLIIKQIKHDKVTLKKVIYKDGSKTCWGVFLKT